MEVWPQYDGFDDLFRDLVLFQKDFEDRVLNDLRVVNSLFLPEAEQIREPFKTGWMKHDCVSPC